MEQDARIIKGVEEIAKHIKGLAEVELKELLSSVLEKKSLPKEALKLKSQQTEAVYAESYRLYNAGKFKEAADLFRLLILLNPAESRYILGLAACFHMKKEYKNAAESYLLAASIDPENPVPYFHAADCYINLKDLPSALIALEMSVKRAKGKEECKILKDRSLFMIKSLEKQMAKR